MKEILERLDKLLEYFYSTPPEATDIKGKVVGNYYVEIRRVDIDHYSGISTPTGVRSAGSEEHWKVAVIDPDEKHEVEISCRSESDAEYTYDDIKTNADAQKEYETYKRGYSHNSIDQKTADALKSVLIGSRNKE